MHAGPNAGLKPIARKNTPYSGEPPAALQAIPRPGMLTACLLVTALLERDACLLQLLGITASEQYFSSTCSCLLLAMKSRNPGLDYLLSAKSPVTRKLKIVYLHQYFIGRDAAGGTRSYELARRMVRAGHEVHVVSSTQEKPDAKSNWKISSLDGIHVHAVFIRYSNLMPYWRRLLAFVQFAARASLRSLSINGDVIYASSTPLTIAIPALIASKIGRRPMIFEVRDLWPTIPIAIGALRNPLVIAGARWLERRAYFGSRHVVALSPGMADGVAATGYSREQISVIPNACDTDLFRQVTERVPWESELIHWQGERALVLYAGTLGFVNGVPWLVDVALEAKSAGYPIAFLVVGSGAERDELLSRARAAGVLDSNMLVRPPLRKSQIPALLEKATAAISLVIDLPEMGHNSANKVFDAMAAGKPLIINYAGWQKELLERTGAGIAVPYTDAREAARLIHELVNDPVRVSNASNEARKLADGPFNRNALAKKVIDIVEAVGRASQK